MAVVGLLTALVTPAGATHGGTLSGSGGNQTNVYDPLRLGGGGNGGTREPCVAYDVTNFQLVFESGTVSNGGTTTFTASSDNPIVADVNVDTPGRWEGPHGTYGSGDFGTDPPSSDAGCKTANAGTAIPSTNRVILVQRGSPTPICDTTTSGTMSRGAGATVTTATYTFTITGANCGTHGYTLTAVIRRVANEGVCNGPFPADCNIDSASLA